MSRAVYAASRVFITHDESGAQHLNTPYFLGVLTSAAIHSTYRPSWQRSPSSTFNDFGSTIGGDAGMHVFHAFQPDIQHIVKGLSPRFVSRLQERITRSLAPKHTVTPSAR